MPVVARVGGDEDVVGHGVGRAGQNRRQLAVVPHVGVAAGLVLDDRRVVDERVVPGRVAGLIRVREVGGGAMLTGNGHAFHRPQPRQTLLVELVGDATATVGQPLLERLAGPPVEAVALEQRRRGLAARHRHVVVGAHVAGAVVLAGEGALGHQAVQVLGGAGRPPRGAEVLVLEHDGEHVLEAADVLETGRLLRTRRRGRYGQRRSHRQRGRAKDSQASHGSRFGAGHSSSCPGMRG